MKSILNRSVWIAATFTILAAIAANPAHAATRFDGGWSVQITTLSGACDSGSSFGLQVQDGDVHGYGGFDVRGRVRPNGAVQVSISSGDQSASGNGRLLANSGGGTWSGAGSRGTCRGRWTATRR